MCSILSLLCFRHSKKWDKKQHWRKGEQNGTDISFSPYTVTTNEKLRRRMREWIPLLGSTKHFLFVNTQRNMQMWRSRHWLISCRYCHTEEIQQVKEERGAFFSMSEQTIVWWHSLLTVVCLVLLEIMALLIKAVVTYWEISNSSSPSNLLWGCKLQNPFI